ncbi:DNA-directed RNA polymerase M/15kDa subunit [Penicillium sp. DV-2018c]|nr:DNA-directed RNA polymerase M/15kDa subunit [Penicillium sp. DV-2018c]
MGVNRFECRVCPYEAPLDREYYEKKEMKQKEVDDVFGGKEEFANADSVATQCPAESCNGERAYFFQLQIRSADEPMTTFLKVLHPYIQREVPLTDSSSVLPAVLGGEKIRGG